MGNKRTSMTGLGRPRSETARRDVLDAARELFESGGLNAATIEAIAARSGVAKTTIYRRWTNRATLLVDLLVEVAADVAPPPEGKDPLHALRTELRMIAVAVNGPTGRLMASLASEAHSDSDVRSALLEGLFYPRTTATAKVVAQAQALGLIRPDVPPRFVVDMLVGPVFYRLLIQHEPVTERFVKQVFDEALEGLRPRRVSRR